MSTGVPELLQDSGGTVLDAPAESPAEIAARSPLQLFWRRLRRDKVALTALAFIVLLVLVAIFAPLIVRVVDARPPSQQDPELFADIAEPADAGPNYTSFPILGTDNLGRDVFSRTVYGARVSLEVAFIATGLIVVVGVTLGMIAGYYRGWVDTMLARSMDVMLAFPVLLLALGLGAACSFGDGCRVGVAPIGWMLVFAGVVGVVVVTGWAVLRGATSDLLYNLRPWLVPIVLGLVLWLWPGNPGVTIEPGLPVVIFVIFLASWPYIARIIRGQVLSLREKEFVEAAQSLGASNTRIIFRHILPNLVAPIIVYTTLIIPQVILFEASLAFLGVGVQPPTPSWGAMIADATGIFDIAWWFMTFPGLALLLTVLAFNLVGDGLQDALNPRTGR